jgi:hypothetical protein
MLAAILAVFPAYALAAIPNAGATTSDVFPPPGSELAIVHSSTYRLLTDNITATANPSLFPPESVVGYPGPTATGVEPEAIQTAPVYAYNSGPAASFPLVADKTEDHKSLDIFKYWGNLSPW